MEAIVVIGEVLDDVTGGPIDLEVVNGATVVEGTDVVSAFVLVTDDDDGA